MYCGDETGSFIGDLGSHSCRFGYGGEDHPKYVQHSYVAYNHGNRDRPYVPTSCYSGQLATDRVQPIMKMAFCDDVRDKIAAVSPEVHPAAFWQQGDRVLDWDALETAWQAAVTTCSVRDRYKHTKGGGAIDSTSLDAPPLVHPVLAITPGCTHMVGVGPQYQSAAHRHDAIQYTEFLLETLHAPACFLAPTPMVAAFCAGRQTCLLVDMGAGGCRVTPMVDGLLLKQAQRRNGRGSDYIHHAAWRALVEYDKLVMRPRYQMRNPRSALQTTSPALYRWAMQDLMTELRTGPGVVTWPNHDNDINQANGTTTSTSNNKPPFVRDDTAPHQGRKHDKDDTDNDTMDVEAQDSATSSSDNDNNDKSNNNHMAAGATYELPDGTIVDLTTHTGRDLRRIPELFFSKELPFGINVMDDDALPQLQHCSFPTLSNQPLQQLVWDSLTAVGDADLRKELAHHIVLVGGASLVGSPGAMEQRLSAELAKLVPAAYKCRVLASRNSVERSCAAWIGASILTSLGSFQQLWLSRTEYDEYGATLAVQRFPV